MASGSFAPINSHVADVGSPPIPEAQSWTRRYDGSFGPLINLSQAVPGNAPHASFLERLGSVAGEAMTSQYGPINGDASLRQAYAEEMSRLYEGRIEAADTAITAGCNMAFFVAMMLLARRGESVLVPTPWYFNHQMSLDMLGIEPRPLPCRPENGFVPRIEDAEALIDEKVRAIVLVTPNNPTGAVYPAHVVEGFAELCAKRGIYLVIDETYRDFLPQGMNRAHGLFTSDAWRRNVIQLYSFSKSYAIPGHRMGAITADAALIEQIAKILDCIQICPPRTAQAVLPWAIEGLRGWREENRAEINRRAQVFRDALASLPEWKIESVGAYFAYLRHPFEGAKAQVVAEKLATERGVLCLPGSYFGPGQEGHLRIAVANVGADVLATLTDRLKGLAL
ncbi:aminotransferase [Microvirga guangxiensis]|uniref:Aminotransferase n=1 Tax=Microvirga guangxiensis TaxID=549386 RepID=A0A1G5L724_9HYPH|nr:aminotransferase [Microvirga guangxiensis]SCZ07989.1 Aminotransferase class I and II [Microvirga guangxiensis]